MRILILSTEYPPTPRIGGIGTYSGVMAPALAARGHDVHVLSCAPGSEVSDETVEGVTVHRRPIHSPRGSERVRALLPRSASRLLHAATCWTQLRSLETRFDVVESPEWMAEGFGISLTPKSGLVVHLHSPTQLLARHSGEGGGLDLRLADRMERSLARRADVVTAPSRLLANDVVGSGWLRGADPEVIPHPIDVQSWAPARAVSRPQPVVLSVGRVERLKSPESLVKAASVAAQHVPGLEVVFVGESAGERDGVPYGEWISRLARSLGVMCRIVGWVPRKELIDWYRIARVVVVSSSFESFSMTAVEAAASGCPVVYSSGVGVSEVLTERGGGIEVPYGDVHRLADAIARLTAGEAWRPAGLAAAAAVENACAADHIAAQREQVYERAREAWMLRGRGSHR